MYIRPRFRGKGLGKMMLEHLEAYALKQGTTLLRLETGIYQPEAMGLYERMGYRQIPAFPPYVDSTTVLSRFYEKRLVIEACQGAGYLFILGIENRKEQDAGIAKSGQRRQTQDLFLQRFSGSNPDPSIRF